MKKVLYELLSSVYSLTSVVETQIFYGLAKQDG